MDDRRRYRKIFIRLWKNPAFRGLTDCDKVMALYLLSGPQTNRIGLFYVSFGAASEDLGTTVVILKKRLDRVCATFGWQFDVHTSVIWIPSWWNFNSPSGNENNMQGALSDVAELPSTPLITKFANNLADIPKGLHRFFGFVIDRYVKGTPFEHCSDTVRTQEKEQEQEQEQEIEESVCSAASAEPVVLTYPTTGAYGHEWGLTERQLADWRDLFPSLDILAEARKALAWLQANPGRRKTAKGMPRFLVSWFSRATDSRGGSRAASSVASPLSKRSQQIQQSSEDFGRGRS